MRKETGKDSKTGARQPPMPQRRNDTDAPAARPAEALPPEIRALFDYLIPRGWYLSLHATFGLLLDWAKALREGNHDAIESGLREYARERLPVLLSRIEALAPERAHLIRDALEAHQAGKYTLSIPVMLAQADGLTRQVFGGSIVSTRREKANESTGQGSRSGSGPAAIADRLYQQWMRRRLYGGEGIAWAATLGQLSSGDISGLAIHSTAHASRCAQDPTWGTLNRHTVLHGESLDYGTEANGLRAVLLLDFICDLIQQNGRR